eukprot:gene19642-biopygen16231
MVDEQLPAILNEVTQWSGEAWECALLTPAADPCAGSPCSNGGVCSAGSGGGHTCDCVPGFTGTDCGTAVDECDPNPCPGHCTQGVNSFTCAASVYDGDAAGVPHMPTCARHSDTDVDGADVAGGWVAAQSAEECCAACAQNSACVAGVLYQGKCYMKSSSEPRVASGGRTLVVPSACSVLGAAARRGETAGAGSPPTVGAANIAVE